MTVSTGQKMAQQPKTQFTKLFALILLSFISLSSFADEIIVPDSVRDQIVTDVMTEQGYYDAAEIENRIRIWQLEQPQPRSSGELTDSGACGSNCTQSGGDSNLPVPRNVKFKGKIIDGKYTQNLIIKWKRPVDLPENSGLILKHYKIALSKDGATYEKFKVKAKFKNNGKPKKHQKLRLRGLEIGNYEVQVRATYTEDESSNTAQSSALNKSNVIIMGGGNQNGPWSQNQGGNSKPQVGTVGTIDPNSALYQCLIAGGTDPSGSGSCSTGGNKVCDNSLLANVTILDCSSSGLSHVNSNYDIVNMLSLTGLTSLDISDNPLLTNIVEIGDLDLLQTLDISKNPNIDLTGLEIVNDHFDSLSTLKMSEMGLSNIPEFPETVDYIDLSKNSISSSGTNYIPTLPLETLILSDNSTSFDVDGEPTGTKTIDNALVQLFDGVSIKTINAINSNVTNVRKFAGIPDLANLNVSGGNFTTDQNLHEIPGLCSLTIQNTQMTKLQPSRPIQFLNLDNNPALYEIQPASSPEYRPKLTSFEESNKLLCNHLYSGVTDNVAPVLNNMSVIPNPTGNPLTPMPTCPIYNSNGSATLNAADSCLPNTVDSFKVYEDLPSGKRYLTWDNSDGHDDPRWGITHYLISVYDNGVVRYQLTQLANEPNFVIDDTTKPNGYSIQACNSSNCSDEVQKLPTYDQGLTIPTNLDAVWGQDSSTFEITFDYLSSASTEAQPERFEIYSTFPQSDGSYLVGTKYVTGGSANGSWVSDVLSRDSVLGSTFNVKACRDDMGCSHFASVAVSPPHIEDATLPNLINPTVQLGIDDASTPNVDESKITLVLSWDFDGTEADKNLVEYIKITEQQPFSKENTSISSTELPNMGSVMSYNSHKIDEPLTLSRFAKGHYDFTLQACHKVEDVDHCSDIAIPTPNSDDHSITLLRSEIDANNLIKPQQPHFIVQPECLQYDENNGCLSNNEVNETVDVEQLRWTWENNLDSSVKPDYFLVKSLYGNFLEGANRPVCRTRFLENGDDEYDHTYNSSNITEFRIDAASTEWGSDTLWTTFHHCTDFGYEAPDPNLPVGVDPTGSTLDGTLFNPNRNYGQWQIQACVNGVGCSIVSTVCDAGDGSNPLLGATNPSGSGTCAGTDFIGESSYNPVTTTSVNSLTEGPGDFKPGAYWHKDLGGTGWHFYWVNGLNQTAQDGRYGKAYDLVGYWFSFQYDDTENIWTPVWYEARLRKGPGTHNSREYYQGNLYVHERSSALGVEPISTNEIDAGNIQLLIHNPLTCGADCTPNRQATLVLDLDYDFFTQFGDSDNIGPYKRVGTTLELEINDLAIDLLDDADPQRFDDYNDNDHYSGLWQHGVVNPEAPLSSAKVSMLTWIKGGLENDLFAYFDDDGRPIWLMSQSCPQMHIEPGSSCDGRVSTPNNPSDPPPATYFDQLEPESNLSDKTLYTIWFGYNPLSGMPVTWINDVSRKYVGKFGRQFEINSSDTGFKDANFWLSVTEDIHGRSIQVDDLGNSDASMFPLEKRANLHGIFYDIVHDINNDITEDTCDPNSIGPCEVYLNWFTDDDFDIEPWVQKDSGLYQPLGDLISEVTSNSEPDDDISCIGTIPTGGYSVSGFNCTFNTPGGFNDTSTYTFQLRKHKYETSGFEVIAQSEGLIIRGCGLTGGCEINPIDAPIVQISDPVVSNVNGSNLSDVSHHEGSGPLPGSAGVSGGAATYNIPMVLPPGRKGMAPELSINYSSKGGNGVMGMGWSVPMGSSIYRCPATKAQDNYFHAVDFTDEDRLCLDGQKLKRISGSYLVTNSEYRNELDSFAKIKYNDYVNSEGLTVDMFKVFTKSGRVNTYEQLGNQQSTWYLVNEQDSFGNSINYSYNEYSDEIDPVFGVNEYLVTEIWYTGTGYSHGTRRIKFNYGTDGYDIYYQAGEASEKTQRLNSVQTFVDSVMEREYAFTFKASNSDGKRLLTKVTEKAGGVSGVTRDLTDVLLWSDEDWVANGDNFDHFEYSNISTLATGTNAISASLLNKAQIKSDFNGDGIKEFITTSNDQDTRKMLFFNSNNQLKGVLGLGGTTGYRFANVVGNADFNVDGITDMMIIDKDGNNCPGAVTNSIKILTWDNDKKLVDDVLVDDGTIDQYFNTSEYCGINLDSYIADGITLEVDIEKSKFYLTDYNSDGLQDIIFHRVPKIINNQALCYPGGFTTGEAACTDGVDATSDLIAYLNNTDINSCSTTGSCNYSFTKQTGDPIAELITHGDREAEDDLFVVIWQTVDDMDDYNGDGLVDFHVRTWYKISVTQEAHARYAVRDDKIYFSTVTSDDLTLTPISLRGMGLRDFDCDLTEASVEENCYDETLQHSQAFGYKFTDVNGDGLKDYLYYDKGESYLRSWKVRLNKGGNILSDLFSGESINSTLNSDENLAFLDQYDECENLDDNSPDEQFRICNPYFRIASEFVDLNGDGIQEFVFPDPDPQAESSDGGISYQSEKMPFNYCGQFQSDGIEVYDFTTYDYTLFNFLSFLDNISDIPYVPDGVNDIIHDGGNSDSQADWLAGIFNSVYTYTPGIDPDLIGITKFACSYSHKDNVDSLGEKINDIYRDFGSSSATYDHGVYPYKALKFDIVKDINGDDVLDLKLIEKTGIYKPLFAGSIGDINGDGLVDVFSAMGCVQSADNACRESGGSIINSDAINTSNPNTNPWDGFINDLKVSGGVAVASHAVVQTPNLLESISKPNTDEYYEWDYHPISFNLDRADFPLYDLPGRGNENYTGYIEETGGKGEYFYFNSSMFVVSEMRYSTGIKDSLGIDVIGSNQYAYEEAVYNNKGRGFQGFRTIKVKSDPYVGNVSIGETLAESTFHQVFPLAGRLNEVKTFQIIPDGSIVRLSESIYHYDRNDNLSNHASGLGIYYHPMTGSVTTQYEPENDQILSIREVAYDATHSTCTGYSEAFDDYGNVLCTQESITDYVKIQNEHDDYDTLQTTTQESFTRNTYGSPRITGDQWWVDKLGVSTVSSEIFDSLLPEHVSTSYDANDLDRKVNSKFFWGAGDKRELLCKYTYADGVSVPANCGSSVTNVDTTKQSFIYDTNGYGNVIKLTTTGFTSDALGGLSEQSRMTESNFDLYDGYFADEIKQKALGTSEDNVLDLKTNYIYDVTTGQVTQSKDPNNIKTNMVYDVFGVLTSQNVQDNSGDYLESTQTSHMQNCAVVGCTSADSIIATAMANIQTITNTESPFGYQMSAYEGFYFNNNFIHKPVLAFKTESHQPGTPKTTQWLDQNGQVVLTESEHSGGTSYVLTLTNPLGQTELITQPFVLNTTPYFNLDDYDDYGRMSERMVRVGDLVGNGDANCWRDTLYTPVQGKTEVTAKYDGAGCETTLNSSLTMYRSYDSQGKLRHTKDATDKTTKYWYDSMGNPYIIADAVYNEIVTQFDDLGRKKSVDDPNMGIKYFSYNSFGEVIFEQDAEQLGQVGDGNYTIYDPLGRLATKYWNVDAAYLPLSDVRSYRDNFTYSNSCGSLTSVCNEFRDSNFQEPTSFSAAQHKSYLYDEFGRVINQDIELIDVFGGLSDLAYVGEFSIDYHYYENYNFLKQTVYNRAYIRDDGDSFYSVVNHYDLYGSLLKQTKSDPDPIDLMENISFNHRGQVEVKHLNSSAVSQYFYHDGTGQVKRIDHSTGSGEYQIFNYEYDAWGNITEQNNGILGQTTETFVYDELQRLKSSSVVGNGHSNTITYDYDIAGLGNLVRKSDYSNTQAYDQERNAGPNAITSAVLINGDGTIDYSYDLKGNRILDVLGTFESHYVYDANNLLIHARDQVGENVESEIDFRYGVDQQRYLKYEDSFDPTSPIRSKEATVYAGPYFEEVIDLVFLTKELKLQVSDYLTLTVKNNNRIEHHFMQKDRLGSTTQILDENNIVVKTMSYDAFGKPRNGDTWNIYDMSHPQLDFSSDGSIDITKRGFTDHEHLDNFELIHMNGRMYDFNNGRFLSVDPFIHGVTSQGINPYSYILNNPLAGTDPTGYVPLMIEEAQITGLIPTENSSVEEQKAFMRSEAVTGELVIVAAIAIDGFSDYINPLKGIAKKGIKETFKTVSEGFKKAFTNGKDKIVSTKDTNRAISSKKTQTSTTDGGCSFIAGTLVVTQNGFTEIQDISVGDMVSSKSEFSHNTGLKKINHLFKDLHNEILLLTIKNSDETIEEVFTTEEHPFMLFQDRWIPAGQLVAGDYIETISGGKSQIKSVTVIQDPQMAYNFEVNDFNTYAVGENGYWVHNKCKKEYITRRTNAEEAEAMQEAGGLVPKPGHENTAKWVTTGKKPQSGLNNKTHSKTVVMEVEPGTIDKLKKLSTDIDNVNGKETGLPGGVLTKTNEQNAMGIGKDLIKVVNDAVKKVEVK